MHETENGTVYSVTIIIDNGDVYKLIVEAYTGTLIKAELNGKSLEAAE